MNEAKEREVRETFARLFEADPRIKQTYKRIAGDGVVTYEEANKFAKAVGKALSKTFASTVNADELDDLTINLCEKMLSQNVQLVNSVCNTAQSSLNRAAGLGIQPIPPKEQIARDRIQRAIGAVRESGSVAMLTGNTESLTVSVVDSWVKTNADFQYKAGLHPVIVRVWDGVRGSHDTKKTDLCSKWEGVYQYGTEPKEIYSRHVGCGCVVSYYPDNKTRGRVTALAKGGKDVDGVLYNTGKGTSNSPRAIRERMKRNSALEDARKLING